MTNIHVYQWFNINTLEYYIGYTMGKVKNYICSSKYVKPRVLENPSEWHKEILAYFETGAEAREFETKCIKSMWGDKLLLNRTITGKEFSTEGKPLSIEHRQKLKDADRSNWKLSDQGKQNIIDCKKGIPRSNETKEKLRKANLGKKVSEETKLKIGLAFIGRKHSKESIDKMKKSAIGKKHSAETIEKLKTIAKTRPKRKHSEETKKKISESAKLYLRKPHTQEAKDKISKAVQLRHELKRNKNVLL